MSDTNRAVQPHKMVSGFKFRIQKVDGMYYLCSEKRKGADQLRGHREADLRLCFRICRFSRDAANLIVALPGGCQYNYFPYL